MIRRATTEEVRKSFEVDGHTVEIDRHGYVKYKKRSDDPWFCGGWTGDYVFDEELGGAFWFNPRERY